MCVFHLFSFSFVNIAKELVKIPGVSKYELRLLWHLFFLRSRKMHVVPWVEELIDFWFGSADNTAGLAVLQRFEHGDVLCKFVFLLHMSFARL